MERIRKYWQAEQPYEPIAGGNAEEDDGHNEVGDKPPFHWIDYMIFVLLGVSMLWAWNMFLAAGPYFQRRFASNAWVFENFQAAELSVASIANLGSMLVLSKMQRNASYPKRIVTSLAINVVIFTMLAMSTRTFVNVSAKGYFGFLIIMVFATSLATGLCQNGLFAFASGFSPRYMQGIMTGQAIAGVLPCIAQIASVLSVMQKGPPPDREGPPPHGPPPVPGKAAFAYFLTATGISLITLAAFLYLQARHAKTRKTRDDDARDVDTTAASARKPVPLLVLYQKLFWLANAVFITFAITMQFPVFTQRIVSIRDPKTAPAFLQPPSFIPLAFLIWNTGDLLGRLLTAIPKLSLVSYPRLVFLLALVRLVFIPLYQLCNIRGQGAAVPSDAFYLIVVQLLFGTTNGFIGSTCMMGAGEWVDEEEREAAGGFMGLCLVAGLAVGSFLSFFAAGS
ncbi:hypothetical protein M8818_005664 [Zalaria obscura]|uniref:Uncharacterized protein n=1 Tax=Zalaria obscura TaxID=2024903 RepID=A0ACC3S9J0_9PEZI